jgi:hypothetical protein
MAALVLPLPLFLVKKREKTGNKMHRIKRPVPAKNTNFSPIGTKKHKFFVIHENEN